MTNKFYHNPNRRKKGVVEARAAIRKYFSEKIEASRNPLQTTGLYLQMYFQLLKVSTDRNLYNNSLLSEV